MRERFRSELVFDYEALVETLESVRELSPGKDQDSVNRSAALAAELVTTKLGLPFTAQREAEDLASKASDQASQAFAAIPVTQEKMETRIAGLKAAIVSAQRDGKAQISALESSARLSEEFAERYQKIADLFS